MWRAAKSSPGLQGSPKLPGAPQGSRTLEGFPRLPEGPPDLPRACPKISRIFSELSRRPRSFQDPEDNSREAAPIPPRRNRALKSKIFAMPASLWQLGEFRSQRAKPDGLAGAEHASGMLLAQPSIRPAGQTDCYPLHRGVTSCW